MIARTIALAGCLPLLLFAAKVEAQPAYPGGPTVVINQPGYGDPYAQTPSSMSPWGPGFPAIGGSVRDRLWIRGDYLYWFADGMDTPPLVTSSPNGTPANQAGVLGLGPTTTRFGGDEINDDWESGFRVRGGFWLTPQGAFGIEGEYFEMLGDGDGFSAAGTNTPILARPFFDTSTDRESSSLVVYPGLVNGSVRVSSDTELRSALFNARASLVPVYSAAPMAGEPDRVDWIIGYRYLELGDQLSIAETRNSENLVPARRTIVSDEFRTENKFHGVQLGVVYQANFSRAWLESMLRVAVGNNAQEVRVSGNTSVTQNGITTPFAGGLLAQASNIGTFEREEFTMIPELGLTFGVRITSCFHATVGYSILYLPNVVRAGDQIDTDVNATRIPNSGVPATGSLRPQFTFVETDYWAQGLSLGGEFRF